VGSEEMVAPQDSSFPVDVVKEPIAVPVTSHPPMTGTLASEYFTAPTTCFCCGSKSIVRVSGLINLRNKSSAGESLMEMSIASATAESGAADAQTQPQVAFPKDLKAPRLGNAWIVMILFAACGIAALIMGKIDGALAFAALLAATVLVGKRDIEAHRRRSRVWNRLYFCSHCGHVFDPVTGTHAPASTIHLLYKRA